MSYANAAFSKRVAAMQREAKERASKVKLRKQALLACLEVCRTIQHWDNLTTYAERVVASAEARNAVSQYDANKE
jgi:hypothetical protein